MKIWYIAERSDQRNSLSGKLSELPEYCGNMILVIRLITVKPNVRQLADYGNTVGSLRDPVTTDAKAEASTYCGGGNTPALIYTKRNIWTLLHTFPVL